MFTCSLSRRYWPTLYFACFICLVISNFTFGQEKLPSASGIIQSWSSLPRASTPPSESSAQRRFTDAGPSPVTQGPSTASPLPTSGATMTAGHVVPAQYALPQIQGLHSVGNCGCNYCVAQGEGSWVWVRDAEEERRRAIRIYNVQCVRCHGVQGKGVWDIPDVPNFTNRRWQQSRTDADIVRLTLSGRGACMPAFKGTITLDEAWAIARYIRALGLPPAERETTDDQAEQDRQSKKDSENNQGAAPEQETSEKPEEIEAKTPVFLRSR